MAEANQCGLCSNIFDTDLTIPQQLQCEHFVCQNCFQELLQNQQTIQCPFTECKYNHEVQLQKLEQKLSTSTDKSSEESLGRSQSEQVKLLETLQSQVKNLKLEIEQKQTQVIQEIVQPINKLMVVQSIKFLQQAEQKLSEVSEKIQSQSSFQSEGDQQKQNKEDEISKQLIEELAQKMKRRYKKVMEQMENNQNLMKEISLKLLQIQVNQENLKKKGKNERLQQDPQNEIYMEKNEKLSQVVEKDWGIIFYSQGGIYKGQLMNYQKNGQGFCNFENGDIYEGE